MIVTDFRLEHRIKFDDKDHGIRAYRAWFKVSGATGYTTGYYDFRITDELILYSHFSIEEMAKAMTKIKLEEQTQERIFI